MNNRQDAQRELRELLGFPERDTITPLPTPKTANQKDVDSYVESLLLKDNRLVTRDEKQFLADGLKQFLESMNE